MPSYTYAVGGMLAGPEWGFEPQDPTFNFYLKGQAHDFTFTLDAQTQAALHATDYSYDVWAWRDGVLFFRGPIVNLDHTGGADQHTISYTANSYRSRMGRLNANLQSDSASGGSYSLGTHNGPDAAWTLISGHLGASAGSGGTDLFGRLVKGAITSPSASTFAASVNTGVDLASAIDSLADVQAFDWDLVANDSTGKIEFQAWQPGRGSARPDHAFVYIFGKPGNNCTWQRTQDVTQYANRVYINGQNTSGTQWIGSAQADWKPAGRYTTVIDGSSLDVDSSKYDAQAKKKLLELSNPTPAYTITPREGLWGGPSDLWLGDQPTILIRSGPLNVPENTLSINQITLAPKGGTDGFSFSAGAKPFGQHGEKKLARDLQDMSTRIRLVEWNKATKGA